MASTGRLDDSARMLRFLDTTSMFDNPTLAAQVSASRAVLAAKVGPLEDEPRINDHYQALRYVRQALDRLVREGST